MISFCASSKGGEVIAKQIFRWFSYPYHYSVYSFTYNGIFGNACYNKYIFTYTILGFDI